jgi:hypothetical protein
VLDAQVLLDPFEEELDPPAVLVEGCNGGGGQAGVVGQKDQSLVCGGVGRPDSPNVFGVILDGVEALAHHVLIGNHPSAPIGGSRIDVSGPQTVSHEKIYNVIYVNPFKGALGDALHLALCGASHNIRLLLKKLRLLFAQIWQQLLAAFLVTTICLKPV